LKWREGKNLKCYSNYCKDARTETPFTFTKDPTTGNFKHHLAVQQICSWKLR